VGLQSALLLRELTTVTNSKGISRIVMIYRPENLARTAGEFSRALGVDFEGPIDVADIGVTVMVSWSSGLELIAPLEGGRMTEAMWGILRDRGEGMFNLVFQVPDLSEAEGRAAAHGFTRVGDRLNCLDVEPSWCARFRLALESPLPAIGGVSITLIQLEPACGVGEA
jgi:hypothetical protein